jgi:hypothetical protein
MEIAIHKVVYENTWGAAASDYSKGFFPAEMAFSERSIPALVAAGIQWVIVPNNHISRACAGYPYSPSGDNNDPPNPVRHYRSPCSLQIVSRVTQCGT